MIFRFAACISLLVVFVCALVPAGSVHTRFSGSAFDPTTSVMSLRETAKRIEAKTASGKAGEKPDRVARTGLVDGVILPEPGLRDARHSDRSWHAREAFRPAAPSSFLFRARAPPAI